MGIKFDISPAAARATVTASGQHGQNASLAAKNAQDAAKLLASDHLKHAPNVSAAVSSFANEVMGSASILLDNATRTNTSSTHQAVGEHEKGDQEAAGSSHKASSQFGQCTAPGVK